MALGAKAADARGPRSGGHAPNAANKQFLQGGLRQQQPTCWTEKGCCGVQEGGARCIFVVSSGLLCDKRSVERTTLDNQVRRPPGLSVLVPARCWPWFWYFGRILSKQGEKHVSTNECDIVRCQSFQKLSRHCLHQVLFNETDCEHGK